jgi:hypothetical protein
MKLTFDGYYLHAPGHLPQILATEGLEMLMLLRRVQR